MNPNKIPIESMSMDLLRVALGMHRGSITMARRFMQEALKRKSEIKLDLVKPYLNKILPKIEKSFEQSNQQDIAEDALMYSTLLQNYATRYLT